MIDAGLSWKKGDEVLYKLSSVTKVYGVIKDIQLKQVSESDRSLVAVLEVLGYNGSTYIATADHFEGAIRVSKADKRAKMKLSQEKLRANREFVKQTAERL